MLNPYQSPVIVEGETATDWSQWQDIVAVLAFFTAAVLVLPAAFVGLLVCCDKKDRLAVCASWGVASVGWCLFAWSMWNAFIQEWV